MSAVAEIVALWACRAARCTFIYEDPIGADAVGHHCPTRDGKWTTCRRIEPRP